MAAKPKETSRAPSGKGGRRVWLLVLALVCVCVLLVVLIFAFLPRPTPPPVNLPELGYEERMGPTVQERDSANLPSARPDAGLVAAGSASSAAASGVLPATAPALFFVIDDVGSSLAELKPFLDVQAPLTFSILPRLRYSKDAYRLVRGAGKEAMLHLPMEADGQVDPGPGAVFANMSKTQIDDVIGEDLDGFDGIRWVNNHEGSKATADLAVMTNVLDYLKSRNLTFLDSRTAPNSAVEAASKSLSLPYYKRNSIFLDDTVEPGPILSAISSGLAVARREGHAVMIGHVWDRELPGIIESAYPRMVAEGFRVSTLSALSESAVSE